MIASKTPDGDFGYETEEDFKKGDYENNWSGTDGNWSATDDHSGGDEEWRGSAH